MGLDLGANDYVGKRFSLRELLARVRALLRSEREHRQEAAHLGDELEMAAQVQQNLFPRVLPEAAGLDYAGICRPAHGVSGDYSDFIALSEGRLGFLLADISGKGMPAALLGASLHAAIRSHSANRDTGCGEVLAKASRLLYETTAPSRYATVFFGVYDPATRVLSYANAGHCAPMLVRGRECIRLDSLTPPAGLLPVLPAMEKDLELLVGDRLLIFSDGIPEASSADGDNFGDNGLLDALARVGQCTAAEACEGIVNAVPNYAHHQPQDYDVTLIAVRVL